MPPKPVKPIKQTVTPSASRDLVPTGPKHVAKAKLATTRAGGGEKPTTTRALVLRNGKQGARGTGELMLVTKLSGREKLDLLAEDLVEKSKSAVMSPFRLEECLKIAESQRNAYLDEITGLRDPQLFMHLIQTELIARTKQDPKKPDPMKNASHVASIVAIKIHNTYMLASAWKLVSEALYELAECGVTDGTIKTQLKKNLDIRVNYLVLYDLVTTLAETTQRKFSLLATTTPHYSRYFKSRPVEGSDSTEEEFIFDWAELRGACVSFLDSIVIELCFPRAPYPKMILYQVLRDAVEESPKEAQRFPQVLWDAAGDLSVVVELQQLLEAPLLGPEAQSWKDSSRKMPEAYEDYIDAELYSDKASKIYANFKDIIFPLEKTTKKAVLETMWKYVNLNYKTACGEDIDTLWGLTEDLEAAPQWHAYYIPSLDYDSDGPPGLSGGRKKKPLAITHGVESDDSMPELQSVSNSSDEEGSVDDGSDEEGDDDDDESYESGYDTEQEDDLRELLREAMDIAHEADWQHSAGVNDGGVDPFAQEDRKGNPFLKLLGSLRGRMFSSNPKLKTATRKEPLRPKFGRPVNQTTTAAPKPSQGSGPPKAPASSSAQPEQPKPGEQPKSYKATVEEVEDNDDVSTTRKKKKKKPKKKKPASTDAQSAETPVPVATPSSPPPPPPKSPPQSSKVSSPPVVILPTSPTKGKQPVPPVLPPKSPTSFSFGSTTSLPLSQETAQSARSYLQAEGLDDQKTKVKSRPNHATTFSEPDKKKKTGMFSRILGRGREDEPPKEGAKRSWFSRLTKKSSVLMHQLLRTAEDDTKGIAPMKWEDFLKVMREMGFEYDPSTAGSSVRFDPPDKRDRPITFHRPHPDPTIQPIMLKKWAKRLERHYGWKPEDLLKQT